MKVEFWLQDKKEVFDYPDEVDDEELDADLLVWLNGVENSGWQKLDGGE